MQIANLFAKDINRSINGVIKVNQDDTESIKQELSEYVITSELSRHFADFFEAYDRAIDVPTDKIGVWISGFFGSGKSHFLKMLSYLLSNRVVDGVQTIEYFDGKVENPLVYSQMRRAAEVPTESILFNIDSKAGQWKEGHEAKTALLRAFARVFYEHQGFYGEDLKLAKLEQFIANQGKTDEFRASFARINGGDWLADRSTWTYFEDDITEVLQEVMGMSREAAQHWFDGTENDTISIDRLTDEIDAYVDAKADQHGGSFRLLFMVDEVGQFIGDDVNLMLNLQTIVEELGAKCQGRVWVMVTSQEAIDDVIKVAGNDFSKIQGRFDTRLSLSSSSVDEVIKRRVLEKTDTARTILEDEYENQAAVLKNLFTFEGSQSDLVGFEGPRDFQESYPFVAYQFKVVPNVLAEIRKHGYSGKHLSSGERSMLSGFQEAAQQVQGEDTSTLVPLWRFYNTISTFLEHGIRQVIERASKAAEESKGLVPHDVDVLKTLYLIRYITDIKPTVGNIAILMIDDMDADKISLREQVQGSLDRLMRENYVGRNGDRYTFLTDEEQDIAREISNTKIDPAKVTEEIKKAIFDGIFPQSKHRKGRNDYPFDRYVDDTLYGVAQGGMKLNVITVANAEYEGVDSAGLALRSVDQALVQLPDDARYYEALQNAAKIDTYTKTKNIQQLPESTQRIIREKQKEAHANRIEARSLLADAIGQARVAVNGQTLSLRAGSASEVLKAALDELVGSTFTKAEYITASVDGQNEVLNVLAGQPLQGSLEDGGIANRRALDDVRRFLEAKATRHEEPSMGEIQERYQRKPYGWRENDVAAVVASLLVEGEAQTRIGGTVMNPQVPEDRKRILSSMFGRSAEGMSVVKRDRPSDALVSKASALLREYAPDVAVPADLDALLVLIRTKLEEQRDWSIDLLKNAYDKQCYPGQAVVERGLALAKDALTNASDEKALLLAFTKAEDDLLDWLEDVEVVRGFFPNQQAIFDSSVKLLDALEVDAAYLSENAEAQRVQEDIRAVLEDPKPYGRIPELVGLNKELETIHSDLVRVGREELLDAMTAAADEVRAYANDAEGEASQAAIANMDEDLARRKGQAHEATTRAQLDAASVQLDTWRKNQLAKIDNAIKEAAASKPSVVQASTGEVVPSVSIHAIERSELCPPKRLKSEQDVDAYVARIRQKLMDALSDGSAVSIR